MLSLCTLHLTNLIRHLLEIVDALIVCNQRKTLSGLSRLLHHSIDPKALADFFRESPWSIDQISQPSKKFMLATILELAQAAGIVLRIMVSLGDSLGKKGKATKHLDAVDYHHNHNESTRKRQAWSNGYVYVELHVQIGPFGFLFDARLYLREKKVRKLNRSHAKEKRLQQAHLDILLRRLVTEIKKQPQRVEAIFQTFLPMHTAGT